MTTAEARLLNFGLTRRVLWLLLVFHAGLAGPALAQAQEHRPPSAEYDELQELLDGIQTRVDEMNASARDTDAAMRFLSEQVEAAIHKLSSQDTENAALRGSASGLSQEMKTLATSRDDLNLQVARLREEKDEIFEQLQSQVQQLASLLSLEREVTANLRHSLDARATDLRATLEERDRMAADLDSVHAALAEQQATSRAQLLRLAALENDIAGLRSERATLDARLATETTERETAKASLEQAQSENRALGDRITATTGQIETLNRQLAELRAQIAELNGLLESSEAETEQQQAVIEDLGRRLNLALATKVRELARYRSEFFGRLRAVLGERSDVRIVGDRFVFQSEVLFQTGEAELGPEGQAQLIRLADSLKQIAPSIPEGIDWALRIDGHTDERPIQTARFPSNWELSTARAISVVRFLIDQGLPADRVMAAGFAHYRPLDGGDDDVAFRRNRRIEFRLTQK